MSPLPMQSHKAIDMTRCGGTIPLVWNAGTLSPGDSRITVPTSVMVPANASTTLTVTVSAKLGETV